jgi:hypothetical protein
LISFSFVNVIMLRPAMERAILRSDLISTARAALCVLCVANATPVRDTLREVHTK